MNNTILKDSAFRALVKPSNEDSFFWYIAGLIDAKKHSYADLRALSRYQSIGYRARVNNRKQRGY
tara:strand:- start:1032 stop:1226 length:195 start_codon:yes stop_codon:yes gene_type:complete